MMFALRAKMAAKNHWFHGKSPAAKKAYIAAHPNSIYAKQAKVERGDAQRSKTAEKDKSAHNENIKQRRIEATRKRREEEQKVRERQERLAKKREKLKAEKKRTKPNAAPSRSRVKPNSAK